MTEKAKSALKNLERLLPRMTDSQLDRLLAFGEGMEMMKDYQEEQERGKQK